MALEPLPDDHLAAVVTSLEQRTPPAALPPPDPRLRLARWPQPEPARYRALFRAVGARWLWFSRLALSDRALAERLAPPATEVYAAVDTAGRDIGLVELALAPGEVEIAYFGLAPEWIGQGLGRALMAATLARAWQPGVARVWLHTCTLDHPGALGFYRAHGFVAFRRQVEIFADPRLLGLLPPDCAPQIPLLGRRQ